MRTETIQRALAILPCARAEIGSKLGRSRVWGNEVAAYLLKHGYATCWGSALTAQGTLSPILHPTGKQPV